MERSHDSGAKGRRPPARRARARVAAPLLGALLLAAGAPAGASPPWTERSRLLGDPAGARSRVERLGVTLQIFSNHFGGWAVRGGAGRGDDGGHSASADLFAVADLEELAGWRGGTLLLHLKSQYDRSLNERVGALADPFDDADFDEALYVDELWLQQGFAQGRLRVRVGFQEQQTVFDRNAFANSEDRQFMNAALDNDPLVPLPNGLAVDVIASPASWLELAVGVADADNVPRRAGFDTAFDDIGSLGAWLELAARVRLPGGEEGLPGTWRLGVFRDGRARAVPGDRDPRTGLPETRRGHYGAWLSVDQLVWREPGEAGRRLGLFLRAALADRDVNPFPVFGSLGLEAKGLVTGRPADTLGLGFYRLRPSSRARDATDARAETGVEVYYALAPWPWLVLTPGVQAIFEPGGAAEPTVLLAALRVRVSW
ncbi:MAG: carbohydrate porin [Myxococcota bacterium]|nr:carbohydrate porin [Myxococcota bacterium]